MWAQAGSNDYSYNNRSMALIFFQGSKLLYTTFTLKVIKYNKKKHSHELFFEKLTSSVNKKIYIYIYFG